jgi:hypothetical protein
MADNVTYLPRPRAARPAPESLGLYIRAGRNDHKALGDFATKHGFTQILAPTHLLQDGRDPWLARDLDATEWLRAHLDRNGAKGVQLIYSLAVSYSAFRNRR